MFLRFSTQKSIFAYISRTKWPFLNFRGRAHSDVIVYINGWYLFWYQWKEDVHTYTLVVNLGLYDLQYW